MLAFLVALVVLGGIIGAIARLLVPGRDPMGIGGTILLGIVGSFVGGFLADVVARPENEDPGLNTAGWIGSIVGAIVVLLIYRAVSGRSRRVI